ncbi:hypothetical protein FPZ43_02285 [Mucilaginibacter pallidiroseus]|uniref:DUF6265 domain-containing protein n=1 Tax=Mucilaginibacter pallidiroseus TaxID=2599295 RepID=A0A563UIZ1_9SPHI|nr:DUF6265 family protein [Mucilaginibacter pallidiroseus]TWR31325.1 hypothetical protein FPZ43_02285 [Mucilaginibacter pallidiroseus]
MKKLSVIIIVLLACLTLQAQNKQKSVTSLAFMAGDWRLKHKWGDMQELWSAPYGDNVMGTFRCVKDGKVVFYEFMVVEQGPDVPVLKLRHFNKGSIGWEEKTKPLSMPAIDVSNNQAVFLSIDKKVKITYERIGANNMDCILDEKGKDGKWTKEVFSYVRFKN